MDLDVLVREFPYAFKSTGIPVWESSVNIGKKIKAVRIAEGLSQPQMAQLIDIPLGSLRDWEQERGVPRSDYLMKITKHERFEKYAFWLTTDKTLPESGQIAPDFSILLECGVIDASDDVQKLA